MNKIRKGEVKIYKGKEYIAIPEIEEESCTGCCFYDKGICLIDHADDPNCLHSGMIWEQKENSMSDIKEKAIKLAIEAFDYISSALEDYTNISVYNFYCDNNDKDNINRKPNTGMIDQYMDYIKFINDNVDEGNKIIYDTIMMIGDASGKEGQFSDSDKKTAENFGCEYMDVDDFVDKYKD